MEDNIYIYVGSDCQDCGVGFDPDLFYIKAQTDYRKKLGKKVTRYYPSKFCKKCELKRNRKYRNSQIESARIFPLGIKGCKECRKPLRLSKFPTGSQKDTGTYSAVCSSCVYLIVKKRGRKPPTQEQRRRYDNKPQRRIGGVLQSRIRNCLKQGYNSPQVASLLGCSHDHFRKWIESQFRTGMSFDNYGRGGWEIDHIIPKSQFDLTDPVQQKKCFHYSNMQPLWSADNAKKGSKLNYALTTQATR